MEEAILAHIGVVDFRSPVNVHSETYRMEVGRNKPI